MRAVGGGSGQGPPSLQQQQQQQQGGRGPPDYQAASAQQQQQQQIHQQQLRRQQKQLHEQQLYLQRQQALQQQQKQGQQHGTSQAQNQKSLGGGLPLTPLPGTPVAGTPQGQTAPQQHDPLQGAMGHAPMPAPRASRGAVPPHKQRLQGQGQRRSSPAKNTLSASVAAANLAKYHQFYPSGSETDVSTSTENLTQEERFLLRNMEREDPQGEENAELALALHQHHQQNPHDGRSDAQILAIAAAQQRLASAVNSRLAAQGGAPPNYSSHMLNPGNPRQIVDSPSGFTPTSANPPSRTSLQEEILVAKMAALASSAAATPTKPSVVSSVNLPVSSAAGISVSSASMKLNPSVYSHPNVQDPLLTNEIAAAAAVGSGGGSGRFNLKSYQPTVLAGLKPNVEMTSSGASFDPKAVNRVKSSTASNLSSSSDIIAQLTREMRMQQLNSPGGLAASNNGLFSGSSELGSSAGGSLNQLNQPPSSVPQSTLASSSVSSAASSSKSPAKSKGSSYIVTNRTSNSSSSGYKSDNSVGSLEALLTHQEQQHQQHQQQQQQQQQHYKHRNSVPSASLLSASLNLPASVAATPNPKKITSNSLSMRGGKKAPDKLTLLSRSQPDLSMANDEPEQMPEVKQPQPSAAFSTSSVDEAAAAADLTSDLQLQKSNSLSNGAVGYLKMIEHLQTENRELRTSLDEMTKKIGRVAVLEAEMSKIHAAYDNLLKHSEKREGLEKAARQKLQNVIMNLTEVNKEVTERHEAVMAQFMSGDPKNQNIPGLDNILRGEIVRKDALISQLMAQNKMLIAGKERQDIEMSAQQETLDEQRSHIQILDTALSTAQTQVLRLEEENRTKEGYVERIKQMTKSLEQLQAASEKREAMEKKLRLKLEEELHQYREAHRKTAEERAFEENEHDVEDYEELRFRIREMEERALRLESERSQWEQRYLEEAAMRQVAIDTAAIPKDARIAALEKNTVENEHLIAVARAEKMKQFEDMQQSQRKLATMENTIKALETTIAEQTASIRILETNQSSAAVNAALLENPVAAAALAGRSITPQPQPSPKSSLAIALTSPQVASGGGSLSLHASPTHLLHARQLSNMSHLTTGLTPLVAHGKQLSTPALAAPASSYGTVSNSAAAAALLAVPMASGNNSFRTSPSRTLFGLRPQHAATAAAAEQLGAETPENMFRAVVSTPPSAPASVGAIHPLLKSRQQLLRSATPSAELLRAANSGPHQTVAQSHLLAGLEGGRRDSAPGDVLAHSLSSVSPGNTLKSNPDLLRSQQLHQHQQQQQQQQHLLASLAVSSHHHQQGLSPLVVSSGAASSANAAAASKLSIASLKNSAMNKSSSTYSGIQTSGTPTSAAMTVALAQANYHRAAQMQGHPPGQGQRPLLTLPPASSAAAALEGPSYMDDSIDSVMVGPMSSTYIDHHPGVIPGSGSPAHSMRNESNRSIDSGNKNTYMEVWRI